MVKVIGSFVFLLLMAVGGYFADANFKRQVDGMLGKSKTAEVAQNNTPAPRPEVRASSTLASIIESGVVRASVQNPSRPFYTNEGSRPSGFNVDFMNILFAQSEFGGRVKVDTSAAVDTYEDVPKQLLNGRRVDIAIDGLTFNDNDLPGVVYSIPYVKDFGYSLITARGTVVNSSADTTGMKIGVLKGDPDARAFAEQAFPTSRIIELSDRADTNGKWVVGHIKSGAVDGVMYDYPFAVAELAGTDLVFAVTKISGSDIQYRIGVRKDDRNLLAALNTAIRKTMDTPEYLDMLKKYFMSANVAAVRRASASEGSYVVARGDTLGTIAHSQLGDKNRFRDIQTRNNLANPNFIVIGQRLVIPK
jgi:ABC-type amino acid transport substrate-binding protein